MKRLLMPGGAHGRGRCPRGRHGVLKYAGNIIAMMVPLILLGIFMMPPVGLVFAPPEQVGLRVCVPGPVVLSGRYLGIAPGTPWRQSAIQFATATSADPGTVEDYTPFGAPFDQTRACQVTQLGAVPLIQLLPRDVSLAAIAGGRYDGYLNAYARAVGAFKDPVVLSFAHEMNARWWSWGYQHTSPAVFIAAWRHVWNVFARADVENVTWLWNVNRNANPGQDTISPAQEWWPGARYVDWIGIDAYFNTPADTFTSVFGATLASIRQITSDPVLITETAIAPSPQQDTQIRSLFAGASAAPGVLGFVWFDLDRREAWHLEDRPAALAVFRAEASQYETTPYGAAGYEWNRPPSPAQSAATATAAAPGRARSADRRESPRSPVRLLQGAEPRVGRQNAQSPMQRHAHGAR
jgi:Glycosyl hydrolase family 26